MWAQKFPKGISSNGTEVSVRLFDQQLISLKKDPGKTRTTRGGGLPVTTESPIPSLPEKKD